MTAVPLILLLMLTMRNGICLAQMHTVLTPVSGAASAVTQRRINEWAAALEQARWTLVEESGLRQPNETLHVYLYRVAQPLSAESPAQYTARIDSYLAAFAKATAATLSVRRMPTLLDNSTANQIVWQRAVRAISLMSGRVRKSQTTWTRTRKLILQKSSGVQGTKKTFFDTAGSNVLGSELEQTLGVVLEARSALRDARP